ncbi:MAG: hypothetical protein Q4G27_00230 [Flavobacteriaceae bacterium]|nr:hypothetical protein [Flavobacteriaceae bacterium]
MKNFLFLFYVIFGFVFSFSQSSFEKGYVVIGGQKQDVWIDNQDWSRSPLSISYKVNESDKPIVGNPSSIEEFGVYNSSQIYRSKEFSYDEKIPFRKNFVRVILDGAATLYSFLKTDGYNYYFETEDADFQLLSYEQYQEGRQLKENALFRGQLRSHLTCEDVTDKILQKTNYSRNDLKDVFQIYNQCKNQSFTDYTKNQLKTKFSLSLMAGTGLAAMKSESTETNKLQTEVKTPVKAGLQAEVHFPFKRYGVSAITGIFYSSHNMDAGIKETFQVPSSGNIVTRSFPVQADFSAIEIPLGAKYYINLVPKHRAFVNLGATYYHILGDLELKFDETPLYTVQEMTSEGSIGFFGGVGYMYNQRLGAEIRYSSANGLKYEKQTGKVNQLMLMLSYKIF